ncbi:MAG: FKBP-type peptidyl-prolyl cis-trans isomerase [Phycisphaerae bacterium]
MSESGLWYVDTQDGTGESPEPSNLVKVHYTGWLADGSKFDSSRTSGKPLEMGLGQFIDGFTEGVSSMKVGGKRFLVIPPELGYGTRARPKIPANSTLVFEVELISFTK